MHIESNFTPKAILIVMQIALAKSQSPRLAAHQSTFDIYLRMLSMVFVSWRVSAILGNRYGIQRQNYVALLEGSKITAGLFYRNWILIYNVLG